MQQKEQVKPNIDGTQLLLLTQIVLIKTDFHSSYTYK